MEMCNIHVLTQVTAPYSKLSLLKYKNVNILLFNKTEGKEIKTRPN
jgi:hypothetical protein